MDRLLNTSRTAANRLGPQKVDRSLLDPLMTFVRVGPRVIREVTLVVPVLVARANPGIRILAITTGKRTPTRTTPHMALYTVKTGCRPGLPAR